MNNLETLVKILENKITEGLEELPKLSPKTEDFTICLNNTLSSIDLVNKLTYRPQAPTNPAAQTIEPKAVSESKETK